MKNEITDSDLERYALSGVSAKRLEPQSSNLISLTMSFTIYGEKNHVFEKTIVMDIFQLKNAFRYILQAKDIKLVDDFILIFPTLHFYAKFDRMGRIEKALPISLSRSTE